MRSIPLAVERNAIRLRLLDVFGPLVQESADQILALDQRDIDALRQRLNVEPMTATYPDRWRCRRVKRPAGLTKQAKKDWRRLREQAWFNTNKPHLNPLWQMANGRFGEFLWAPNETAAASWSFVALQVTPIGTLGPGFATRMLDTTRVCRLMTEDTQQDAARDIYRHNASFLRRTTARGIDITTYTSRRRGFITELAPLISLHEGFGTIQSVLAQMTAESVAGMTGEELLRSIARGTSVSRFARHIPMGRTDPLTLRGRYFRNVIDVPNGGPAVLSDAMLDRMAELTEQTKPRSKLAVRHNLSGGMTYQGCPVAGSPIDAATRAFVHVFEHLG